MMLEALVALAERKGLIEDPRYGKRVVHYQLRIDDDGRPVALVPLGEDGRGRALVVPVVPKRTVAVSPAFLVDNAQYLLGIPKRRKGQAPDSLAIDRAAKCQAAFASEIRAAVDSTKDEGLTALVAFLDRQEIEPENERARVLAMATDHEWTGEECIAVARDADGATYLHDRPQVRAYWSGKRAAAATEGVPRRLVTGILRHPCGSTTSSTSRGSDFGSLSRLVQCRRVHVSAPQTRFKRTCLSTCGGWHVRALNWLLEKEGERRFRSGLAMGSDTVLVFWTRDDDTVDVLLSLFAPEAVTDEDLRAVFSAAWRLAPRDVDTTKFYALTLVEMLRAWSSATGSKQPRGCQGERPSLLRRSRVGWGRRPSKWASSPRAEATPRQPPTSAVSPGSRRGSSGRIARSPFPRELLRRTYPTARAAPRTEWRGRSAPRRGHQGNPVCLHPNQEVSMSSTKRTTRSRICSVGSSRP